MWSLSVTSRLEVRGCPRGGGFPVESTRTLMVQRNDDDDDQDSGLERRQGPGRLEMRVKFDPSEVG